MTPRFSANTLLVCALSILGFRSGSGNNSQQPDEATALSPLEYTVNLNDRTGDTFKVTLSVNDLGPDNAVYQFASTAPGTYQVMDIGRYVRSFEAVDESETVIPSENISTNQWRISEPERVSVIRYSVAETWDTPVDENAIYMMAGTSIENDHVLINAQAVFGFPSGMQDRPLRIQLVYPSDWTVGTALEADRAGALLAKDFDHAVDSPILMGRLSTASLTVRGGEVEVFTYSKTDKVHSRLILDAVTDILNAAGEFLIELPVDRYAFLFHFDDIGVGALEHSYSSAFVLEESAFEDEILELIPDFVAHEFFHVVTPLNIHSEIIEYFNFEEPVASEHIWLYEGATEWASDIMQLRSGLIDIDNYLGRLTEKLTVDDGYDKDYSLSDLSLNVYSQKGQQEFGNIYQRGALVAGLLDLKILELSNGTRGLREAIIDLAESYGPDTSFVESTFFEEFAGITYPDVLPIFNGHIRGTEVLPMAESYANVGIEYLPELNTGEKAASLGLGISVSAEQEVIITRVSDITTECGMEVGDVITSYEDIEFSSPQKVQQAFGLLRQLGAGEPFTMNLRRGDDDHNVTCAKQLVDRIARHVFRIDPDATPEQIALRTAWMKNLTRVEINPAMH